MGDNPLFPRFFSLKLASLICWAVTGFTKFTGGLKKFSVYMEKKLFFEAGKSGKLGHI